LFLNKYKPTPVSALIHAATMVTAGVYLLIRCSPLIEQSQLALNIILMVGAITAFFAASIGLFQNDIKKIIAWSTMSQLAQLNQTICVKLIISNTQITKAFKQVISEAIRLILFLHLNGRKYFHSTFFTNISESENSSSFYEWLAGVIDGDGYFNLSNGGSARLIITMDIRDKSALYEIKQKLGGSIYTIGGANALKYQLSDKKSLILLLNNINGLVRNPIRITQMNKLCIKYGIELIYPEPLTFNNGWLSGFIDSDGSIYFNEQSGQVFISISQKDDYLLEPLIHLYGGRVDKLSPKIKAFKYIIYRKNELYYLIDNYFNKYPLRTKKCKRLQLIKEFYSVRISKNNKDINKFHNWVLFKDRWENYKD
jgi:hypothetical protein